MNFKRRRKAVMEFQQSAMTDVTLQLLIFFFLTSTFVSQSGIKLKIPTSTTKPVPTVTKIVLSVSRGNDLYVNDEKVIGYDQMSEKVTALLEKSSDKKVIVKADQDTSLQDVVKVMDVAKQAGAEELALATKGEVFSKSTKR